MGYREHFPDFTDHEHAAKAMELAFSDDTSWGNDQCPSFTCDVFVLWIDYPERERREFRCNPRFMITDEGNEVLSTDDWADVVAFVNDGKRDFPPYEATPWVLGEEVEYANGFRAVVKHVDGELAILETAPGDAPEHYILAEGCADAFSFPHEAELLELLQASMEGALRQLAESKAA